jgi:bacterial leucyl aminopeptidase
MRLFFAPQSLRCGAAVALLLASGSGALAAPTWITLGERAMGVMQDVVPAARALAVVAVPVQVPDKTQAKGSSLRLLQSKEAVHAVEIDEEALPALSEAIHERLHRCGGFVQHNSMAEALAVLNRLPMSTSASGSASGSALGGLTQALAPSYAIDNADQVNAFLPQLQASNLLGTIGQLSNFQNRRHTSSHGVAASNWLFNTWSQINPGTRRDVKVRQINHTGWAQKSVEFEIIGTGNSGETIIIGAHLDSTASGTPETVRAPGADDDASGVAGLTEVIRVLMANNYYPRRNIRFIAYAAEEAGLLGSRDIAINQALRRDKVVGVLQLDMTAFKGSATDLWIYTDYTNAAQNQFLADLAAAYLPSLTVGYDACGYGCSDHASWHNRGFVASFPFEASDTQYNFQIHTANDTIATFGSQAEHALKFTKLALAYTVELASDGAPPPVAVANQGSKSAKR